MPVLGIDVGGFTSTVATISRGAIDVALNDVAQRYTPTCVSFTPKQRLFGEQAQTQIVSNYRNTCRNFATLLGRSLEDNETNSEFAISEIDRFFATSTLETAKDSFVGFKVPNEPEVQSCLGLLTGYLGFLADTADKFTMRPNREVVVAYPGWFSEIQKECLRTAVKATGLSCLRVISHVYAMAMDYGVYRVKQLSDEAPTTVALVMVGHCHASAAIVDFYASHCEILSQVSKRDLGGRNLDMMLMKYMAETFQKKYKLDPLENIKTRLKVEAVATKAKRVLSANAETSFSAECLMEDYDLSGSITRQDFEAMCAKEFLPALTEMLQEAIAKSGKALDAISSVEIAGGCTRIPCVQQTISNAFGKPLSRTLNADECVARGCVLEAAIRSNHYRVREYRAVERLSRPLCFSYLARDPENPQGSVQKQVEVAPVGSIIGDMYKVSLDIELPAMVNVALGDATDPRSPLSLGKFHLDKQVLTADEGEAKQPEDQQQRQQRQQAEGEGMQVDANNANATANAPADGEAIEVDKEVVVSCFISEVGSLHVSAASCDVVQFPAIDFDVDALSREHLKLKLRDELESARLQCLNDFETLLYMVREKMCTTHRDFLQGETVEAITKELDKWRDWLYDNSNASQEALLEGIDVVKKQWEPVEHLYTAMADKEAHLESFLKGLQDLYDFCCQNHEDEWFGATPEERFEYSQMLLKLDSKVRQAHADEANRPKHLEPLFTMQQVQAEFNDINGKIVGFIEVKKTRAVKAKKKQAPQQEKQAEQQPESQQQQQQQPPQEQQANDKGGKPKEQHEGTDADFTSAREEAEAHQEEAEDLHAEDDAPQAEENAP